MDTEDRTVAPGVAHHDITTGDSHTTYVGDDDIGESVDCSTTACAADLKSITPPMDSTSLVTSTTFETGHAISTTYTLLQQVQ
mmetsp:Transcript_12794/g.19839  ORF Transcript_12794/g.19839 Transcript_12794/m.19839 type:complete len:83 (-) Transcript_12794:705-953(-)